MCSWQVELDDTTFSLSHLFFILDSSQYIRSMPIDVLFRSKHGLKLFTSNLFLQNMWGCGAFNFPPFSLITNGFLRMRPLTSVYGFTVFWIRRLKEQNLIDDIKHKTYSPCACLDKHPLQALWILTFVSYLTLKMTAFHSHVAHRFLPSYRIWLRQLISGHYVIELAPTNFHKDTFIVK